MLMFNLGPALGIRGSQILSNLGLLKILQSHYAFAAKIAGRAMSTEGFQINRITIQFFILVFL